MGIKLPLKDRTTAGRMLAESLHHLAGRTDLVVLALPRGGVPVAFEVADALGAILDLMVVRKLGAPGQEELAMGAIASGGVRLLNHDVVRALNVDEGTIDRVAQREQQELERRERAYRGDRPWPGLRGQCVILSDDGLATGATMRAAVTAVRKQEPARMVVAVPVAPPDTVEMLKRKVDEVACLATPEPFLAIGRWYEDFRQVSDDEVRDLLARAWRQ